MQLISAQSGPSEEKVVFSRALMENIWAVIGLLLAINILFALYIVYGHKLHSRTRYFSEDDHSNSKVNDVERQSEYDDSEDEVFEDSEHSGAVCVWRKPSHEK